MNKNDSINEIKRVLEKIRTEKYSQIPPELVVAVVDQYAANTDSEAAASNLTATQKLVFNHLDNLS